jgi:hypothetical protein
VSSLAFLGLAGGAVAVAQGPDTTEIVRVEVAVILQIVPCLLLSAALIAPRTIRWLRKCPRKVAIAVRRDQLKYSSCWLRCV